MNSVVVLHNYDSEIKAEDNAFTCELYGTNKPFTRQKLIYTNLSNYMQYDFIHLKTNELTIPELIKLNVHSKEYLNFLENCYDSYLSNPDPEMLRYDGIVPYHFSRRKPYQSHNSVLLWRQAGYYCDDVVTPIYKNTFNNSMASANICYSAYNYLEKYKYIYCLTSSPGHHAMKDGYGGYCYLNNAMICAKKIQSENKDYKIAIFDIDFHHGNGTQDICWNDESCLAVSIHANPSFDFPSFSGFESENKTNIVNIIFDKDAYLEKYLKSVDNALEYIKLFDPNILIIPFGADTLASDPDASELYKCGLKPIDFITIGTRISQKFKGKIIITQEGGYDLENVPEAVHNFLTGLSLTN
ncbi:MAG: acetoin utilization deacetylase [Edafosvirus sp.]|uniref:Acetoin utilization deacetylase n=1 Tax=Edafosvirus sp. TaxID=2487765 RepID=A0A3G4ZU29_9VIRU|nr:MAG: acetoin utilization deacetylase [Edafosvirus sp.]